MGNVLLIDGSNLSIIHFTANPAVDDNGTPIGMVKGFLNSIVWLNRTLKPEKIIIFFDGKGGSSQRRELFSEYKEGRKQKQIVGRYYKFSDSDMADKNREYQMSVLKSVLHFLPVNVITTNGYESDDAIAYCVKHKKYFKFDHVYIISCDKDFYQLIANDVHIYNPMSKKILDANSVVGEFGIHPNNWLFYRAISGDKSDNINGIKGIGPKTLLKLFSLNDGEMIFSHEDIDAFYESRGDIKEPTKQKRIVELYENKSTIERNWKLMNLKEPLMSSLNTSNLTSAIETFTARYDKIDMYREAGKLGLNVLSFDEMRFLIKRGN
jgi:5'-3' exonuclease